MSALACSSAPWGADAARVAAAAGFDGVELAAGEAAAGLPAGADPAGLPVVAVRFGEADAADPDALAELGRRAAAAGAPLATFRAAPGGDGAMARASAALVEANARGEGPVAPEVPAAGSLLSDAAAYDDFWPQTTRGRVPLAFDAAAGARSGINANQVWRALASRVALVAVDEELIASPALTPWVRMATAYAFPGAWVVRPAGAVTVEELGGLRREFAERLAAAGRAS